jgi:predicted DNA-binding transcriptional regulator AlpA
VRMNISSSHTTGAASAPRPCISISRWVNESLPPWNQLLTAHDVARLTRRHRWVLSALVLLGRFPKKHRFQAVGIGWRRSEVLRWMSRKPSIEEAAQQASCVAHRCCSRRSPRQSCLPLECASYLLTAAEVFYASATYCRWVRPDHSHRVYSGVRICCAATPSPDRSSLTKQTHAATAAIYEGA